MNFWRPNFFFHLILLVTKFPSEPEKCHETNEAKLDDESWKKNVFLSV